jgi:hypothetical protein
VGRRQQTTRHPNSLFLSQTYHRLQRHLLTTCGWWLCLLHTEASRNCKGHERDMTKYYLLMRVIHRTGQAACTFWIAASCQDATDATVEKGHATWRDAMACARDMEASEPRAVTVDEFDSRAGCIFVVIPQQPPFLAHYDSDGSNYHRLDTASPEHL